MQLWRENFNVSPSSELNQIIVSRARSVRKSFKVAPLFMYAIGKATRHFWGLINACNFGAFTQHYLQATTDNYAVWLYGGLKFVATWLGRSMEDSVNPDAHAFNQRSIAS